MPGYENQFVSSPDGRRQAGLVRNYEEAPDAVGEAQGTAWGAVVDLVFG